MDPAEQKFKTGFEAGRSDRMNDLPYIESFDCRSIAFRAGYRNGYFKPRIDSKPEYKGFYDEWTSFLFRPTL